MNQAKAPCAPSTKTTIMRAVPAIAAPERHGVNGTANARTRDSAVLGEGLRSGRRRARAAGPLARFLAFAAGVSGDAVARPGDAGSRAERSIPRLGPNWTRRTPASPPGVRAARANRSVGPLGAEARAAALAVLALAALALAVPERAQAQTLEERLPSGDCLDLTSEGPNCGIGTSIDQRAGGYSDGGAIQSASDGDLWSVILQRGQSYLIEVKGAGDSGGDNGGTLPDPRVEIYELDWSEQTGWSEALRTSNDNASGTNKNAHLVYNYPYVQKVQTPIGIRVSSANGTTGSYTVTVRALITLTEISNCGRDETTACRIEVPGTVTGTANSPTALLSQQSYRTSS